MYWKVFIAVLSSWVFSGVHASEMMKVEGEIKNRSSQDVYLKYQSWDTGDFAEEELLVSAGGHVGFNFMADAEAGQIDFALSGGDGEEKIACTYDIKYGPRTFVRGAVTLTGPDIWTEVNDMGNSPAICRIKVQDWDYPNTLNMRFFIK
jgi:hypothetical protein